MLLFESNDRELHLTNTEAVNNRTIGSSR